MGLRGPKAGPPEKVRSILRLTRITLAEDKINAAAARKLGLTYSSFLRKAAAELVERLK